MNEELRILTDRQTDKLCCFIVPYFGSLPSNMPAFLKTCEFNEAYHWLIFTNDKSEYRFPSNVSVNYCSFEEFTCRIQESFDFPISLRSPKKLCDFKPAYGYIFQEEIREFAFWGYCDLDQYFGELSRFIPVSVLEQYDKLFCLGHMTIYRNTREINRLFMKEIKGIMGGMNYRQVFSREDNCTFDEWPENRVNINVLAEQEALRINYDWFAFDVLPYRSCFMGSIYDGYNHEWKVTDNKNSIVYWMNGNMYIYSLCGWKVQCKEVLYTHIQKRNLKLLGYNPEEDYFLITPNRIRSFSKPISFKVILRFLIQARIRGVLYIDEWLNASRKLFFLWKHRFNKYVFRKTQ